MPADGTKVGNYAFFGGGTTHQHRALASMTTGGRCAAFASRSSAGPETASAAPTRKTARRSIGPFRAVDWSAILLSTMVRDPRAPEFIEDCGLGSASVKDSRSLHADKTSHT